MPRKSKVRSLPPEIKEEVDRLLKNGRHTLDDILEHLRKLGADGVSRSALGRYAQSYSEEMAALREVQEVSKAFAQELGDLGSNDASRYLVQMIQTVAARIVRPQLKGDEPSMDSRDLMFLAKAIKDLVGSTKISAELEMKIRRDQEEKARAAAADAASKATTQLGLSDDQAAFIRARILGVQVEP